MSNGIKPKMGICPDCKTGSTVPLIAGRCNTHYWAHRAAQKAAKLPKPRKPIKAVSSKMQKINRLYAVARESFLHYHPNCEAKLEGCNIIATEVHHKQGRGEQHLNTSTWMAVCRNCHRWITDNSAEAQARGFSLPRNQSPKK